MQTKADDAKYTLLVGPRAVYGRDDTVEVRLVDSDTPDFLAVRKIVLPVRYTSPTEDDVISYLEGKASAETGLQLPAGFTLKGESAIDRLLRNLPSKMLDDIRTGNGKLTDFIRKNIPVPAKKDGEPRDGYLTITYGLLPVSLIEDNVEKANTAKWYQAAFADDEIQEAGFGKVLTIKLLLREASLPEKRDIDFLLRHSTHGSRTIEISRQQYDPELAAELMDFVYGEFSDHKVLSQVEDASEQALNEAALLPIVALHKILQQSQRPPRGR